MIGLAPNDRKRSRLTQNFLMGIWTTAVAFGMSPVFMVSAADNGAFSGKIVIDGIIYGESGDQIIIGSGRTGRDDRSLDEFDSVNISTSVDVNYHYADDFRVVVIGEDNLLSVVKTNVNSGVLNISSDKNFKHNLPLSVEVSAPYLKNIEVNGASDLSLQNIRGDAFKLVISGSSDVTVNGEVNHVSITVNGSGDVNAAKLISDTAEIKLFGAGDIEIFAKEKLTAEIFGSGDVTYYGNPSVINKQVLGVGDIEAGD